MKEFVNRWREVVAMAYLLMAFLTWEANPADWSDRQRLAFVAGLAVWIAVRELWGRAVALLHEVRDHI